MYTLSLNSNGTSSGSFTVNSDTIKIKDNAIKLVGSSVFLTDQSNKIVLPIKRVLRTNQNNSYYNLVGREMSEANEAFTDAGMNMKNNTDDVDHQT